MNYLLSRSYSWHALIPYNILYRFDRFDIVDDMRKKLPTYIVESLLVSGYDDIVSIAGMNLDEGPKNSISEIEQYIDKRKANYPQCLRPNHPENAPFEFPPGHKIRIEKFVCDIKFNHSTIRKQGKRIQRSRPEKKV